jgi:AraC-like DNA-binding protein
MSTVQKPDGFEDQKLLVLPEQQLREVARHPLIEPLYVTDIGFFPKAQFHYRERPDGCEATIFLYCIEGEGWAILENDHQILIPAQTLLVLPAHTPHLYGASTAHPWSIYWFHLQGHEVASMVQNLMLTDFTLRVPATETLPLLTLFEQCYETLFYKGYSWRYHLFASQVMRHLLGILMLLQPTSGQDEKKQEYVERATSYMTQHLESPLTLDELAHSVHLSRSHFVHVFKEVTGSTPIDAYLRLKMQRACQYLDLTDQSIKEIARRIGFQDPYYFSRLFRKMMKQSPSEYRKIKKG